MPRKSPQRGRRRVRQRDANPAPAPLHVNAAQVTALCTAPGSTLFDSTTTLPAGMLVTRTAVSVEAFGSIVDPGANGPNVTFALKLGSTTICTGTKATPAGTWHL